MCTCTVDLDSVEAKNKKEGLEQEIETQPSCAETRQGKRQRHKNNVLKE